MTRVPPQTMVLEVRVLPRVPSCTPLPAETKETKSPDERKEAGMETHVAHVLGDFWFWVGNFCFLWIPLFEPQPPLAIELWVYILWVLLPHKTSQIYLNRSWSQSVPHEEAPVDTPVENSIVSRCSSTVLAESTGRAPGSCLKVWGTESPFSKVPDAA